MRKIIVSNLISLDGYFEGINQDISWFNVGEDFFEYARNLLNEVDTILYGRTTYEQMAAYWPGAENQDAVIKEKMNSLKKIVFSNTMGKAEWNNTTINHTIVIKRKIEDEIKRLKQQQGGNMVIFGSGTLVSELTQSRLIDEYRLIVCPVILGNGNPLFKSLNERYNLKLISVKQLNSGAVILTYQSGEDNEH